MRPSQASPPAATAASYASEPEGSVEEVAAGVSELHAHDLSNFEHTAKAGRFSTLSALSTLGILALVSLCGLLYWRQHRGYESRMDAVENAGKAPNRATMLTQLRDALRDATHRDVKERILLNLGHFRDTEAVPQMVEALQEPGVVRRAAATALARIGLPGAQAAKETLWEVLPETSAVDRPQVVWALVKLEDARVEQALLEEFGKGTLQHQPDFEVRALARILKPAKLASSTLLNDPDASVRALIARTLSEASDQQEAVSSLIILLNNELARPDGKRNTSVIREAVAGLGRSGSERAVTALSKLLEQQPTLHSEIMRALSRSADARVLGPLAVQSEDPGVKLGLAQVLSLSHDPAGADAMVELMRSSDNDVRLAAAMGLAAIGDKRSVPQLLEVMRSATNDRARSVAAALQEVVGSEHVGALKALLKDRESLRAAVLRALGKTGASKVASTLRAHLDGEDHRAAALALADLRDRKTYERMLSDVARQDGTDMSSMSARYEGIYRNRLVAIQFLQAQPQLEPNAQQALVTVLSDSKDEARLREAAAMALQGATHADVRKELVALLVDGNQSTRTRALAARALSGQAGAVSTLAEVIASSAEDGTKREAAFSIGRVCDASTSVASKRLLNKPALATYGAIAALVAGDSTLIGQVGRFEPGAEEASAFEELRGRLEENEDLFTRISRHDLQSGCLLKRVLTAAGMGEAPTEKGLQFVKPMLEQALAKAPVVPGDPSTNEIRTFFVEAMTSKDASERGSAALGLMLMKERGVLLAIRNRGKLGASEAESALRKR